MLWISEIEDATTEMQMFMKNIDNILLLLMTASMNATELFLAFYRNGIIREKMSTKFIWFIHLAWSRTARLQKLKAQTNTFFAFQKTELVNPCFEINKSLKRPF